MERPSSADVAATVVNQCQSIQHTGGKTDNKFLEPRVTRGAEMVFLLLKTLCLRTAGSSCARPPRDELFVYRHGRVI